VGFDVLQNSLTPYFHNMSQVNKLLGSIWIMKEICIQTLHHILNLSHNAHFKKSLDYEINAVAHIMHTNMNGAFSFFN
jgi:hypothetical protein